MKYFFLSFAYQIAGGGYGFANLTCTFERFPTQKECKDACRAEIRYAVNITIMGITKLTKKEYEILKSEI